MRPCLDPALGLSCCSCRLALTPARLEPLGALPFPAALDVPQRAAAVARCCCCSGWLRRLLAGPWEPMDPIAVRAAAASAAPSSSSDAAGSCAAAAAAARFLSTWSCAGSAPTDADAARLAAPMCSALPSAGVLCCAWSACAVVPAATAAATSGVILKMLSSRASSDLSCGRRCGKLSGRVRRRAATEISCVSLIRRAAWSYASAASYAVLYLWAVEAEAAAGRWVLMLHA